MKRIVAGEATPALSSPPEKMYESHADGSRGRDAFPAGMTALGDDGVDPGCSAHIPAEEMLQGDWIPLRRTSGGVLIAAADNVPERSSLNEWFPGERLAFRQAGRREIQDLIIDIRLEEVADGMANDFTRRFSELAARTGVRRWQKAAACTFALAITVAPLVGCLSYVASAIWFSFCAGILFKVLLAVASLKRHAGKPGGRELYDEELPTYTILIPAYNEGAVIGDTVRWISELDFPKEKLEVLVLVERRDEATARAVREVSPPDFIRIVRLPPGMPQTKPRSCNLGLTLARGQILVIFDAEDRPERDQLRKVASQFAAGDDRLACIQAKLNYYNERRNPLTRLFSMEYAFWFDLMLPGLARLKLPIPLGGTSNHIRTDVLREVGGWDAWNVTEDADLGLRLSLMGYQVDMADSTTWEECPAEPWAWTMQRTRWLKGYLLTALIYTRRPVDALRKFGLSGMVSLLGIVVGTPVVFMLWPFAFLLALAGMTGMHAGGLDAQTAGAAAAAMWAVAAIMAAVMLIAAYRRRMSWSIAVIVPLYWLLHAFAGWRGLLQLIRAPYKWEKTAHGAS